MTTTSSTVRPLSRSDLLGIRARRKALGLTQRDLAAKAGCSLSYLTNMEAGCVPVRSNVAPRVLGVLKGLEHERQTPESSEGSESSGAFAKTPEVDGRHGSTG